MSGLTTHVLDLASGRPAARVEVRLSRLVGDACEPLATTETDADGRARLLDLAALTGGGYRIEFAVGAYFRAGGAVSAQPAFLEIVAIEFNLPEAPASHHVPLLVSPFGYSTYRGS